MWLYTIAHEHSYGPTSWALSMHGLHLCSCVSGTSTFWRCYMQVALCMHATRCMHT